MSRFFQKEEIVAHAGEKTQFKNVDFTEGDFLENSPGAAAGTLLEILPVHIKNPPIIQFIAYLDQLSDSFSPEYRSEQPFGRVDPYYVWKSSKRTVSVGWSLVSSGMSMGLQNLNNLSWLLASLYPAYKEAETANSIAASPLFRVRYANLIASPTNNGQGLLCVMNGVKVTPDTKQGYISINPQNLRNPRAANREALLLKEAGFDTQVGEGDRLLIPKVIKLSTTLNVVHDHQVGWNQETGAWRGGRSAPGYPYLFGVKRDTQDPQGAGPAVGGSGPPADAAQYGSSTDPDGSTAANVEKAATECLTDTQDPTNTVEKTKCSN